MNNAGMPKPSSSVSAQDIMNQLKENTTGKPITIVRKINSIGQLVGNLNLILMLMDTINEDYLDTSWEYNFASYLKSKKSVDFNRSLENHYQIERLKSLRSQLKVHFALQYNELNSSFLKEQIRIKRTIKVLQSIQIMDEYLSEIISNITLLNLTYLSRVKDRLVKYKELFNVDTLVNSLQNVNVNDPSIMSGNIQDSTFSPLNIQASRSIYDDIIDEEQLTLDGKIMPANVVPENVVCDDDVEAHPSKKAKVDNHQVKWNLKEGESPEEGTIEWHLSKVIEEKAPYIRWNLSYQEVNLPKFIFTQISSLLDELAKLEGTQGNIDGNNIVKKIQEIKTQFLDVINIMYDSFFFLKDMDLNINMQRPKLFPDYMIDIKGVFNHYKNTMRRNCSVLICTWLSAYPDVESFMEENWIVDSKLKDDHNYLKKAVIRAFLSYVIVNYMTRNQTSNLIYDRDLSSAGKLVNDLYINFGSLSTSTYLHNIREFTDLSTSIGELRLKQEALENKKNSKMLLMDSSDFVL